MKSAPISIVCNVFKVVTKKLSLNCFYMNWSYIIILSTTTTTTTTTTTIIIIIIIVLINCNSGNNSNDNTMIKMTTIVNKNYTKHKRWQECFNLLKSLEW